MNEGVGLLDSTDWARVLRNAAAVMCGLYVLLWLFAIGREEVLRVRLAAGMDAAQVLRSDRLRERHSDLHPLYVHAVLANEGRQLYWPWPDYGPDVMTGAKAVYPLGRLPYPPFLTAVIAPLAKRGFVPLALMWYPLLLISFLVFAASLSWLALNRVTWWGASFGATAVFMMPNTHVAFLYGNADPLLWALSGLAVAAAPLRGAGFAAVGMIKLYGAWPLLFAGMREGRIVLRSAAIAVLSAFAMGICVLGPSGLLIAIRDWAVYMLPVIGQGTFKAWNVSLSFAGLRVVRHLGWSYAGGPLPQVAEIYLSACAISAPLLMGWYGRRFERRLHYALVISVAVLFGPVCWLTYLPLLLLPAALFIGRFQVT